MSTEQIDQRYNRWLAWYHDGCGEGCQPEPEYVAEWPDLGEDESKAEYIVRNDVPAMRDEIDRLTEALGAEHTSLMVTRMLAEQAQRSLAASDAKVARAWNEGYEDGVLDGQAHGSGAPGEHETPNPHLIERAHRKVAAVGCGAQGPLVSAACIRLSHDDGRHDDGRGTRWIEETCETCGELESNPTSGCEECIERRLERAETV